MVPSEMTPFGVVASFSFRRRDIMTCYEDLKWGGLIQDISDETGNKITKSGLNHRFRKIREIVAKLENK